MCNPMLVLAASATTQVIGGLAQGRAAQRAANEQAAQLDYQAAVDQDNAQAQAEQIRRQGRSDRGTTLSRIAASGIKIGEGSALDAERRVMEDSEVDASLAILNGDRAARSARAQAESTRRAGRDARRASYLAAAGTLLNAGAQGMRASGGSLRGWDAGGYNGTNDRGAISFGNNLDWWGRNGRGGD